MPDPEQLSQPQTNSEPQSIDAPPEGAAQEAGRYQPPLTDEQISRMNDRRYPKALSTEEIGSINAARSRGIHHGL